MWSSERKGRISICMKRKSDSQWNIFCPTIIVFLPQCGHSYIYIIINIIIKRFYSPFAWGYSAAITLEIKNVENDQAPTLTVLLKKKEKNNTTINWLPPTDHTNPTNHKYDYKLTIQPPKVTHITTYRPDQQHVPQVITIPPQWSHVLPPTNHTTPIGHFQKYHNTLYLSLQFFA